MKDYLKAVKYYEMSKKYFFSEAVINLGYIYFYGGYGIQKNYEKARECFESAADVFDSDSRFILGLFYEKGYGVKQDYSEALKHYKIAAKQRNSKAFLHLGNFYYFGKGIPIDVLRAKYYYELSAQDNNSDAFLMLGVIYCSGDGVEIDFNKGKEYFELSASQNNSEALFLLGMMYLTGIPINKDFTRAKSYFELSAQLNNVRALNILGLLYENGNDVEQDFVKARNYYELSSQLNDSKSSFYLGNFYSFGNIFEVNISKAIHFYFITYFSKNERINYYHYLSSNNIGLIYITVFQDIDKSCKYIKEAGFNEYAFGQNNLGLLYQFYLNNIENAKYMYERSSHNKFALAAFNLGYIYEKNGEIEESIKLYITACENENEKLIYRDIRVYDVRLNISIIFIISFVYLKLIYYHFSKENLKESKKYFVKLISRIQNVSPKLSYKFQFHFQQDKIENSFLYIAKFILCFPFFNLINQTNLNNDILLFINFLSNINYKKTEAENKFAYKYDENDFEREKICLIKANKENEKYQSNSFISMKEIVFENPSDLFDFSTKNRQIKYIFMMEIKNIIKVVENIIYTPPYDILFGRINIEKVCEPLIKENILMNIGKSFYDGFDLDVL